MRKSIFAIVFLAFCPVIFAQQALNNDAVIKLVKGGFSDDLIVATINGVAGTYDTSADGLIALKAAGVSEKVVAAIVAKAAAPASTITANPSSPSSGQAAENPDDPAAPHEAGIYVYNPSAPAGSKMTMLEPSIYTQGKVGGGFASAMSYGIAKVKVKAVIRGAHSNERINSENPVFYFYFEKQGAGLSYGSIFGGPAPPMSTRCSNSRSRGIREKPRPPRPMRLAPQAEPMTRRLLDSLSQSCVQACTKLFLVRPYSRASMDSWSRRIAGSSISARISARHDSGGASPGTRWCLVP